jgi:hypothetical protein
MPRPIIFGKPVRSEMHEFDLALFRQWSSQEQLYYIGLPQVICQFWLANGFLIKALACHASC